MKPTPPGVVELIITVEIINRVGRVGGRPWSRAAGCCEGEEGEEVGVSF